MDVLYVGDDKLQSTHFLAGAESVQLFNRRLPDFEPLLEALAAQDGLTIEHLAAHETVDRFPETVEALSAYDALIVSDLSLDTLLPHFRPEEIPGANRHRSSRTTSARGVALSTAAAGCPFRVTTGSGTGPSRRWRSSSR